MHLRLTSLVPVALFAATMLPAQRASSWTFQSAPGITPAQVGALGKIAWIDAGNAIHAFSSKTRTWATQPIGGTYTLRQTNDWLMIDMGTTIIGYSGATSRFETINVSPSRVIVNPPTNRNDVVLAVLDGTTLWTMSGLIGGWTSRTVPANATIAVERNGLIVVSGQSLLGYSAALGTWTASTTGAPTGLAGVSHTLGWVFAGNEIHGFSAIQGTWRSVTLTQPPQTALASGDVAMFTSSAELVGFSGITGAFDVVTTTGGALAPVVSDHVGYASPDSLQHYCFGAASSQFTTFATPGPSSATPNGAYVMVADAQTVHAYSGLTGNVASAPIANAVLAMSTACAAAIDGSQSMLQLYSAIRGAWYPAPAAAAMLIPEVARNGALLADTPRTTWWGFSAHTGTFVQHLAGANAVPRSNRDSAVNVVEDDTQVAVFDARRASWTSTPLVAGDRSLDARLHRTTFVAHTQLSADLIGSSSLHGALERVPLNGTFADIRANSEVGVVVTTTGVQAFAAYPDLGSEVQFPEFRRMTTLGATFHVQLDGPAQAAYGVLVGVPSATDTPIPGLGDLQLAAAPLVPLPSGTLDLEGRAEIPLTVPMQPSLAGLLLGLQGVVVPTAGSAYLTRLGTVYIP